MGRVTVLVAVALATTLLVIGASAMRGDDILSPGPVHGEHGEAGCADCHSAWKGVPDGKCLECHEEAEDPETATGETHADFAESCSSCHTDHRGRDARLTVSVNHDAAAGSCVSCHEPDLRAASRAGDHWDTGCDDCHSVDSWSTIKIRHDRYFPLRSEGHYGLDCGSCHPSGDYKETTCSDGWGCHHAGTYQDWKRYGGGELEEFDDDHHEELEGFDDRYRGELEDEDEEFEDMHEDEEHEDEEDEFDDD